MKDLINQIQIQVNEKVYIKDPNSSDLGKNIIAHSIKIIDEIGFEGFTFRKLAIVLNTKEGSIYRYFENKHKLLIYITSWYWGWLEYHLVFSTTNIPQPEERLKIAINTVARGHEDSEIFSFINLGALHRIVVSESSKAYLTKEVDRANKEGFYSGYKRLVGRISELVLEIEPNFQYAHTLISTIVEGILHQKYFADHLPSLTDIDHDDQKLAEFYCMMALATIKSSK
ncbi:MAG: TetR/AcrR family transcriptional regulator [Cyclobacteriaceae bacterium]|nr:TetR/AcrR family transcriptional regulator [Cyclobacteriaceae bacterium]